MNITINETMLNCMENATKIEWRNKMAKKKKKVEVPEIFKLIMRIVTVPFLMVIMVLAVPLYWVKLIIEPFKLYFKGKKK